MLECGKHKMLYETDYFLTLIFQTRTVQIHPPFNILTVPNWLFKSHHSLIESTVKIGNTLFLLAHLRNAVPVSY